MDSGSEGNQSEDKDFSIDNILDPPRSDVKDGSSNIDKEMSESHYSEVNQDDGTLILSLLDDSKEEATADRKRNLHVDPKSEVTKSAKDHFRKAEYSHISSK